MAFSVQSSKAAEFSMMKFYDPDFTLLNVVCHVLLGRIFFPDFNSTLNKLSNDTKLVGKPPSVFLPEKSARCI